MAAVKNLGAVVLAACALAAWATVAASAAAQPPGLHLVVLQGEDGENVIEQGAQVPTLVEVRDLNELPVAGASVVFLLGDGGTATLNAGLREVSLTTNALGQAAVMVNPVAVGLVELSVAATFMGETAEALIVQTNFATAADAEAGVVPVDDPEPAVAPPVVAGRPVEAAEGGGGLGTGAILGLAGAGGAVGVGLAVAGGGDSAPPVRPPDPPDPPASVPSRPSAPSVSAGDGLLDVSWNAPASNGATINDYDVQYRRSGAAGWADHPGQFLDRRATIGNLQNGTTYEVRVRAGNSVGKGDWSPSGTGTPVAPATVPSRPSAPSVSAGDGLLEVSWNAPASNGATINDYDVQYRRSGAAGWADHPGQFLDRRATIGNLQNGTTYEVRVRAGNSVGKGDWSPSGTGTPVASATVPSRPSAPTVSAGDGLLDVSWRAPASNGAEIDDYDVEYRRSGAATWRDHPGAFLGLNARIGNLENGTTYEVRVRAGNSVGKGEWSPSGTGTPVASATVPSRPSAPTVSAGDGLLDVSWNAPASNGAEIDDYDVEYRSGAATWRDHPGQFLDLRTRIGNLANGTPYEVRVRAGNSVGKGDWSPSGTGTPVSTADRDALMALYNATNGPSWTVSTNWNTTERLDNWHGVKTDDDGRVINLVLEDNGLNGSIPSSLAGLTSLQTLSLSRNGSLGGPIPSSLGGLANLRVLYLRDNALTGSIPLELGNLAGNLTNLGLWGNRLSGSIPAALCRFEDTINPQQGGVNLSGCGTDPGEQDRAVLVEFYNATNGSSWTNNTNWNTSAPLDQWYGVTTNGSGRVTRLELSANGLSGSIPTSLGNLPNLVSLSLAANGLSGSIPTSLGNLLSLEWLDIGANGLSGSIPSSLGNLSNMTELYLEANWLSGSIPASLANLTKLTELHLTHNRLSGSIPDALCRFEDTINPQFDELNLDVNLPGCGTDPAEQDRAVLVEFYNATNGPNWTNNTNWNTSAPLAQWYGVTTDASGRVTDLEFGDQNNGLTGAIPSSLGNLANLRRLWLSHNQLTGPIPFSFGRLTNLTVLALNNNQLSGSIPSALGNLTALGGLNLSHNQLTGQIPSSLGEVTSLTFMALNSNQLSGSIPPALGNLGNLTDLGLNYNRLTGAIPAALCKFEATINPQRDGVNLPGCGTDPAEQDRAVLVEFYNATSGPNWTDNTNWNTSAPLDQWQGVSTDGSGRVTRLVLQDNGLSGSIPSSLGDLTNLKELDLFYNWAVTGSIPSSLGDLANLERLVLYGNDLSGSIPSSLGDLRNLIGLDISWNQLSGSIPSSLGGLGNLIEMNLAGNGLSGPIPSSLANLANLTHLYLDRNGLTGSIPPFLGNLANLTHLYLDGNLLTGSIPPSLGSLGNLEALSLHTNRLTGSIPEALCRFVDSINPQQDDVNLPGCGTDSTEQDRVVLVELYNATNGPNWADNTNWNSSEPIDQWHGVTTDPNGRVIELSLQSNQLSGSMPSSLGNLTNLRELYLYYNQLNGEIPPSLGNLTNLTILDLDTNQLSGEIPSSLGNLTNLTELYLNSSELTGEIPSSFENLTNLEALWLYGNRLSGSIPATLCRFEDTINPQQDGVNLPGCVSTEYQITLTDVYFEGDEPEDGGWLYWVRATARNTGSQPLPEGNGSLLVVFFSEDGLGLGAVSQGIFSVDEWPPGEERSDSGWQYIRSHERSSVAYYQLFAPDNVQCIGCEQKFKDVPVIPDQESRAWARLSVGDAEAEENVDDTIDFTVTLERAVSGTVSVDYTTEDGSAQAGADYTATSGTLTFSTGEVSKTVQVDLLDDAHDEGEETFTLALSNPAGGVIVDGRATGRIENHDPLPRALMARFGRTAAVHVVEQVEERLQAPREPGVEGRVAGQELRPGMERDLASRLLGGVAGPLGGTAGPLGGAANATGGAPGVMGGMAGPLGGGVPGVMGGAAVPGAAAGLMQPGGIGMASGGLGGSMAGGRGLLDMAGGDMLTGSAFAVNRETRRGGVLSFWSRGARSSFTGREGDLALGGDVRTTMFGADYAKGPLVVGLSLSNSRGLGEYGGTGDGVVASSVTGLYPWLGYKATDRVTVWGVAGYGAGGLMLTPGGGPALESGLSMAMAAGGTRGELIAGGSGGFGLAFKADALWVGTSLAGVDGPAGRLAATEAAVTRFRTGLEGSREFVLGGRVSLRPSAEVGLRHDGGDAETGAGMDVGGGLVLADSVTGLSVDLRVRTLVAHQAEGFRERGMALSFSFDPTPSTPLGFTARVAPAWGGQATGGAEALWGRETLAGLADGGFASGDRLDAEVGYGLPLGSRFVGTPRMGFAATEYGRDYRMGYGVTLLQRETLDFELGVDARRRESWTQGGADSGFLGRATLGW